MKTVGEQAKAFRESKGWSTKEMAAACSTSRQNIETLELKGARTPRYIKQLARVMGTTVDSLLEGRYLVGGSPAEPVRIESEIDTRGPALPLGKALEAIAKALTMVDEATRDSVGHSLYRLALKPEELGSISRNILSLVASSPTSVKRLQDGVIDKSLTTGPMDPRNEQRTSVQESGREAQS